MSTIGGAIVWVCVVKEKKEAEREGTKIADEIGREWRIGRRREGEGSAECE